MKSHPHITEYWFTIEPYVFIGITDKCVLLYNTLDGVTMESEESEVIELLREVFNEENCGIVLLTDERYQNKNIYAFIREFRNKYMGDIINVNLSKGKPVQILPYFNYFNKYEKQKKTSSVQNKILLDNLFEVSIYVDTTTNLTKLISFLKSIPEIPTFNIIGNITDVKNYHELLSFLNLLPSAKQLQCSYTNIISLPPYFDNNVSYIISVNFPIDMRQWENSCQLLLNQTLSFEYIFEVSSIENIQQVDQLIEQFQIREYRIQPVYTGDNICFFEDNVFLTKEDILSSSLSIKDFFLHQSVNTFDFGKLNIMPNGDTYANVNHPILGNIYSMSINNLVYN